MFIWKHAKKNFKKEVDSQKKKKTQGQVQYPLGTANLMEDLKVIPFHTPLLSIDLEIYILFAINKFS